MSLYSLFNRIEMSSGDTLTQETVNALTDVHAQLEGVHTDGNPTFTSITITGAGSSGISHAELSNLSNDDHAQYLLIDGTRVMTGAIQAANIKLDGANNFIGTGAGSGNSGANCSGMGHNSMDSNVGSHCAAFGAYAMRSNTVSYSNGFGVYAMQNNKGANSNGFGYNTLAVNRGAQSNGFGNRCLTYNVGEHAHGFGDNVLSENLGDNIVGLGSFTLYYNQGDNNTAVGHEAFYDFVEDTGNAKTIDSVVPTGNYLNITAHGFGAIGVYVSLKISTTGTLPAGLDTSPRQCKVISVDQIQLMVGAFSDEGTGTHTATPAVVYTNSAALGAGAEPDASNQVMLGDLSVTEVKTVAVYRGSGLKIDEVAGDPDDIGECGQLFTKSDNKLYFRDGAGVVKEVQFV